MAVSGDTDTGVGAAGAVVLWHQHWFLYIPKMYRNRRMAVSGDTGTGVSAAGAVVLRHQHRFLYIPSTNAPSVL
jgi:hypothetical protein